MGKIKKHLPVKFFSAITFSQSSILPEIFQSLEEAVDKIDQQSDIFSFDGFTDYYAGEMGGNLQKLFVSFEKLTDADKLPEMKIKTNQLEAIYSENDCRTVNIDPGYLCESKVVLATTKDYSHRIYIGKGIFADLHLVYQNRSYQPQSWTYPDYKQELSLRFFDDLRALYREQIGFLLAEKIK